jgi:membrane protein involved in colicin uptake
MATNKATKAKAGKVVTKANKAAAVKVANKTSKVAAKAPKAKATRKPSEATRRDVFGHTLTGGQKWGVGLDMPADTAKITYVESPNPKRGDSRDRFAKYRKGMTVGAAIKAGLLPADIRWDMAKGLIKVGK